MKELSKKTVRVIVRLWWPKKHYIALTQPNQLSWWLQLPYVLSIYATGRSRAYNHGMRWRIRLIRAVIPIFSGAGGATDAPSIQCHQNHAIVMHIQLLTSQLHFWVVRFRVRVVTLNFFEIITSKSSYLVGRFVDSRNLMIADVIGMPPR